MQHSQTGDIPQDVNNQPYHDAFAKLLLGRTSFTVLILIFRISSNIVSQRHKKGRNCINKVKNVMFAFFLVNMSQCGITGDRIINYGLKMLSIYIFTLSEPNVKLKSLLNHITIL